MGGFFGITSKRDCMEDVFFGVDYHSHLGTRRGGLAAYDSCIGLQRKIHNIENAPFRTKFEHIFEEMQGTSAIGCISDSEPQPLIIRSHLGAYAICMIGVINNAKELIDQYFSISGGHFDAMTGGKVNSTELLAALIDQKGDFIEGIRFAQESIDGTASILILKDDGSLIAARDRLGRLPIHIGKNEYGYAVSFESFAYQKLGYEDERELGPGEIVEVTPGTVKQLKAPGNKKRICSFLWSYYGYPTSTYEGINVEAMRYRNGEIMAEADLKNGLADDIDYVGGVPDSGTPHAIGYANKSGKRFARAFIKYTPTWARSFMSSNQIDRNRVAKMKQIPVYDLIKDKNLLFVDDSIVRGTQLRETTEFLYKSGAEEVHIRPACPPLVFGCKYLNFSRSKSELDLITRQIIHQFEGENVSKEVLQKYCDPDTQEYANMVEEIRKQLHFTSLRFHRLDDMLDSTGLDHSKLCTYCWNGKE